MSHDENEQQHIKQTRQSIHLQSQPHKKGSPLAGGDNRCNTRIGVVGVSPTDIPRRRLGYMNCGAEFIETRDGRCFCPECGTQLEIKDTKERVIKQKSYFVVITTKEEYQVVRIWMLLSEMRKGAKAKPAYLEIGQYWIDQQGRKIVIGLQRTLGGYYFDTFAFCSPFEIRRDNEAFWRIADEWVYPRIKVTDTIKRNGFKGSCHHIHPVTLF